MTGTLFALASAPGRAAVAIWRISGPDTGTVLRQLTRRSLPAPRRASLRNLYHPDTGQLVDQGLILWFPGRPVLPARTAPKSRVTAVALSPR